MRSGKHIFSEDVQVAIGDIVSNQEGGAEDTKVEARENRVLKTEAARCKAREELSAAQHIVHLPVAGILWKGA